MNQTQLRKPAVDEGVVAALDVIPTSRGREIVEFDEGCKQVRLRA